MPISKTTPHCTLKDIGLKVTGEAAQEVIDVCNQYLHDFAGPVCPSCGANLEGVLGSFMWGIAHGEGVCTGGLMADKCGWPCRVYHRITWPDGEALVRTPLKIALAYHPDCVTTKDVENEGCDA